MSDITLRYTFDAAGTSPYSRSLGPSLLVQTDGPAAEVFGSNLPDDSSSWQSLGTCTGYTPLELTTAFAFLRVECDGVGTVAISAASAPAGGAGGGGSSGGLTNTELRATPVPVSASALPLPTGAATEATLAAASAKLPAGLGPKTGAASLSVTPATGAVTSIGGSITTGGAAQSLAASNSTRRGITVQNTSTGDLRVSPWGTASSSAGYKVAAGDLLVLDAPHCGVGAISIWGATTGQTFIGGEAV